MTDSSRSTDAALQTLDKRLGPLKFGEMTVSRTELQTLGARLNGEPLTASQVNTSTPDQSFIDAIQFKYTDVKARLQSAQADTDNLVPTLLFEIAMKRSPTAASMMIDDAAEGTEPLLRRMENLLNAAQRLDIHRARLPDGLPAWVDTQKSQQLSRIGWGLQGYGIYSGLMGVSDALKRKDYADAAINAGGVGVEAVSWGTEFGLIKGAEALLRNGSKTYMGFSGTHCGKLLGRSAGLIAGVLTLPFDVYTAVSSFTEAANSTGKVAQDHYVAGGLAVAGGVVSIALGIAALAGFSAAAGPVGIAAAVILIAGARIYAAVRQIDEMDDHLELTALERITTGLTVFLGGTVDPGMLDRVTISQLTRHYIKSLEEQGASLLDSEWKHSISTVVNGTFSIELPPIPPASWPQKLYQELMPSMVRAVAPTWPVPPRPPAIKDGDDFIDAREGLPNNLANVVNQVEDTSKGILWNLGGGNDAIYGSPNRKNYFHYGPGSKYLEGGEQDDQFTFTDAAHALGTPPARQEKSYLKASDGNDTLVLGGSWAPSGTSEYCGYDIDLNAGTLSLRPEAPSARPLLHSKLFSIEHVETLAGATNRVFGTAEPNRIVARGVQDSVEAGAGNDHITLLGTDCRAEGGPGKDTYTLSGRSGQTTLVEDAEDDSQINLGCPLEAIQQWTVEADSLVVRAACGADHELAPCVLTIENVYDSSTGQRQLKNDTLVFVTAEGYWLKPDLPASADASPTFEIKVAILVVGKRPPALVVASRREHSVNASSTDYFVPYSTLHTLFKVVEEAASACSRIYIDHPSTDISHASASYVVHPVTVPTLELTPAGHLLQTARLEELSPATFTGVNYQNVSLKIVFGNQKELTFFNYATSAKRPVSLSPISLSPAHHAASALAFTHQFILIMRDGVSYRVKFPPTSYDTDISLNGFKETKTLVPLSKRTGSYTFMRPTLASPLQLKPTPQRIDIDATQHNLVYVLEGQSSTYDVYPSTGAMIKLSTPGASAKTANASTWNIYTQNLDNAINRSHIKLIDNTLWIDRTTFQLPTCEDPHVPLETLNIITSDGTQYDVNYDFETILLSTVNANNYSSLHALYSALRQHLLDDELATSVCVRNICLADHAEHTLYYDPMMDSWAKDADGVDTLDVDELTVCPARTPDMTARE